MEVGEPWTDIGADSGGATVGFGLKAELLALPVDCVGGSTEIGADPAGATVGMGVELELLAVPVGFWSTCCIIGLNKLLAAAWQIKYH